MQNRTEQLLPHQSNKSVRICTAILNSPFSILNYKKGWCCNLDQSQNLRRRSRYTLVFVLLLAALIGITILNIVIGSVQIPFGELMRILVGRGQDSVQHSIIWKIRMPRIFMAAILGGALSLSGFLLQNFFGNPIAGPFVLGISSGAKMTVALTLIVLMKRIHAVSSWTLVAAAFAGALLSVGFILLASRRAQSMAALLVSGIMVGYICSAVTDFAITFADDADIVHLRSWSMGSFSGMTWEGVAAAALICGAGFVLAVLLAKPIGAYRMGEAYAMSVGVSVRRFRAELILLSSLLSACVTAFAGPIAFVGIAVPQVIRRALGTSEPMTVIPASFLGGAVFCMACDMIARTALAPTELNISTVTSIFGAPVVILLMLRRGKER